MTTKPIRVDDDVYRRLLEMRSKYERDLGRTVTFNEALRIRFGFDPMPKPARVSREVSA